MQIYAALGVWFAENTGIGIHYEPEWKSLKVALEGLKRIVILAAI